MKMTHSPSLAALCLLTGSLTAQQFRVELTRDVLDQQPVHSRLGAAAADLDGDGRIDLMFGDDAAFPSDAWVFRNAGQRFLPVPASSLPPASGGPATPFDADGDGDVDVMFSFGGTLRLLRNDGSGALSEVTGRHLAGAPFAVGRSAVADVDGDGDLDVLLPTPDLLLNDGNGIFTTATASHVTTAGFAIGAQLAIADFDGDLDVDFVAMTGLHRNDGSGHFTLDLSADIAHGYAEKPLPCDIDGDGDVDVVMTSGRILVNDGAGIFTDLGVVLPPAQPSQPVPWSIVQVADLDGDGDVDLVLSPYTTGLDDHPSWVENDGKGAFSFAQPHALPCEHRQLGDVLPVDLDADGDLDLVACIAQAFRPSPAEVLYNDGTGGFHNATALGGLVATRSFGRLVVDVDSDGDDDVVSALLHLNDGSGHLQAQPLPWGMHPVLMADLDADGDVDALGSREIWRQDAPLQFVPGQALLGPNEMLRCALALDLDADGDEDLLLLAGPYATTPTLRAWHNDGSGVFLPGAISLPGLDLADVRTMVAADFDGDGDVDIVTGHSGMFLFGGQPCRLFCNDGGTWSNVPMPATPWAVRGLRPGDFDGDGDVDIVTLSPNWSMLYLNLGDGSFTASQLDIASAYLLDTADVDLDGDLDIWTSNGGPRIHVNNGFGQFTVEPQRIDPSHAPHAIADLVVLDLDRDGDPDLLTVPEDTHTQMQYHLPLWNHLRQLRAPHRNAVGGSVDLQISAIGGPQATAFAFAAIATSPLDVDLGPIGRLGIDPNVAVVQPVPMPADGMATVSYPLPNLPALVGLRLFAQALLADSELRLSNTVDLTIW